MQCKNAVHACRMADCIHIHSVFRFSSFMNWAKWAYAIPLISYSYADTRSCLVNSNYFIDWKSNLFGFLDVRWTHKCKASAQFCFGWLCATSVSINIDSMQQWNSGNIAIEIHLPFGIQCNVDPWINIGQSFAAKLFTYLVSLVRRGKNESELKPKPNCTVRPM